MAVVLRTPGGVGVSPGASSMTCIIVKPANLAIGDFMLAHVVTRRDQTVAPPGGWTEIRQDVGGADQTTAALFYKIADAADVAASDFTFTISVTGPKSNRGAITAWTGVNIGTPVSDDSGQYNDPPSTTVTAPTITPTVANCMMLLLCGVEDNNTQSNYAIANDNPGSWNEAYDLLTTEGGNCALALGYAIRPETTATGNGTATTSNSDESVGQLVAIAPSLGWKVNGVTNPAKVIGIVVANIAKVNGVEAG